MTRLGRWMLIGFVVAIGLFALVVRGGHRLPPPPISHATPAGGLLVPVAGVAPNRLTDSWGDARGDGTRAHHAIDIPAARGTPVIAAAGGTIEKLFESRDGGHTIYIRADPATIHYYAHLDGYAPDLHEGIAVAPGQMIGRVGATGNADPAAPHLHFEVKHMNNGEKWWQGREVDPYPILAGRGGLSSR